MSASSIEPTGMMPALLTRTVGGPNAAVALRHDRVQAASSRTSSGTNVRGVTELGCDRASPASTATSVSTHPAPFGDEQLGLRRALTPGRAGHDRDPPVEPAGHHVDPLEEVGSDGAAARGWPPTSSAGSTSGTWPRPRRTSASTISVPPAASHSRW